MFIAPPRTPTKKERIKQAAMALFVERGVQGVSVRDVADAVGCTSSNIYNHWKSFDMLPREMFLEGYAAYGRTVSEAAAIPGPFADRLGRMVRAICLLHSENEVLFGFLLLTQHGYLRDVARDESNPVEVVCRAVAAAMASGEIRPGDPALLGLSVIGIIIQPATARLYGRIQRTLGEMADEIVAMCLKVAA